MRLRNHLAALGAALACSLAPVARAGDGWHHGGHHGGHHDNHWYGGVVVGVPLGYGAGYYGWGPGYPYGYGYPGYAYPGYSYGYPYGYPGQQVVVVQGRAGTAASEQAAGPAPEAKWYYCDSAGDYYPNVGTCPEPWREVPAQPPASR